MSVSSQTQGTRGSEGHEVGVTALGTQGFISPGSTAVFLDFVARVLSSATGGAASDPMVVSQNSVSAMLNSSQTRAKTHNTRASRSPKPGSEEESVSAM